MVAATHQHTIRGRTHERLPRQWALRCQGRQAGRAPHPASEAELAQKYPRCATSGAHDLRSHWPTRTERIVERLSTANAPHEPCARQNGSLPCDRCHEIACRYIGRRRGRRWEGGSPLDPKRMHTPRRTHEDASNTIAIPNESYASVLMCTPWLAHCPWEAARPDLRTTCAASM